jgi:4-hydroxybenzoate polyprenyltransferase
MTETTIATRPPSRLPLRLLSCIRFDEVFVLQGAPLIGAAFALHGVTIGALTTAKMLSAALLAAGSLCLVAHVFVFNDWAGIQGDLKDPNRATRAFTAKGVSRKEFGGLAAALLAASLLLFGLLGATTLILALAIAGLSALYSAPVVHGKGRPVFNSILHLVGGTLHFLLGYATFAAIDARGIAIAAFFALVFTAGHLTHEARDREGDLLNGIRTNAVAFGETRSFVASLTLFSAAYALLVTLALLGTVPRVLALAAALYPVQLYVSLRALRAGLTFDSLRQLQRCYRLIFAVIGAMIVASLLGW